MIEKIVKVDQIEILENGCVQVRTKTSIVEDGRELTATLHRHVIHPGDDYSREDARVAAICGIVHTPEVIAEFNSPKAA